MTLTTLPLTEPKCEPRPYQQRVVKLAIDNFINVGVRSQLVNSPTGSGKTVMALLIAKHLQDELGIGVGWCAMRRNLLNQVVIANNDGPLAINLNMGVKDLTPISMFDKNPPSHDASGRPIKLLIVDEAQHDAASSMCHLHNTIKPEYVLGLSATPYRTDKLKLCFEKVIIDAGIHQLMQQGYLSQYNQYTIPHWNPETVTKHYLAEPDTWGKSVMYWLNIQQATDCLDRLTAAGVRTELIIGDDPLSVREDLLSRFDKTVYGDGDPDGIDVIVNMFILTEGWDCSTLKTAWVRDSQKGPTIQMAGRAFRKHPECDFKQIVQSQDTHWPMQRTATPAESFIWMTDAAAGESWRSVKPSKITQQVANRAILTLAHTQTSMPDFITKKRGKQQFGPTGESGLPQRPNTGNTFGDGGAFIH